MTEAEIPLWLKSLPLAPVYRPTETEFADPIAFISRIEREAASFGICKIIPPLPRPSKKFVLSNLNRSLSKSSELGATSTNAPSSDSPVFTTRQQELGSRRSRPAFPKQVWQSGDLYTLEQFEGKAKAFSRSQLGGFKEVTPLLVESLFWKAVVEKPIYVEYANDVPGSGFAVPEEPFRYISWRRSRKRGLLRRQINEEKCGLGLMSSTENGLLQQKSLGSDIVTDGSKGSSGWKLSNSRWNLQVIARSPGSLTRFMPDDVPGVTSPMVYIGMLFSWFAWHVEDHELHSMNFLHMGSPKTWYAVPQDHASTLEDIVRVKGYGENVDRLAAFTMLGEKTTLLSPEVLLASGIPCCRLVQHPGEFVVTFPRAYHIGFSHGFNCGEAANFATPEWLKFAKKAAIRRAAMNHLPMLSHQQLLYILTMSFVSRIPRTLISGVRSSRLRDRKKEEREIFVKKAFLTDMMNENYRLCCLLEKESTSAPILWEPGMLPAHSAVPLSYSSMSLEKQYCDDQHGCCYRGKEILAKIEGLPQVDCYVKKPIDEAIGLMSTHPVTSFLESYEDPIHTDSMSSVVEALGIVEDESDLPVGLNIDSGSLACVSCGTLGYPFMAVLQPSVKASNTIFSLPCEEPHENSDNSRYLIPSPVPQDNAPNPNPEERCTEVAEMKNLDSASQFSSKSRLTLQHSSERDVSLSVDNRSLPNYSSMDSLENERGDLAIQTDKRKCIFDGFANTFRSDSVKQFGGSWPMKTSKTVGIDISSTSESIDGRVKEKTLNEKVGAPKWDVSNVLLRPRVFCLQHAIEVEGLLQSKGGAHIRVICHSDYLKFKAYASTIAEEVGTSLQLKDVPLENASQEDLNLINLSIDEGEHQDDGKDWTSKLGVNLRYCVKHRKISALTQEPLPSALNEMFSSSSAISVVSRLRWLCRKSRTHAKSVSTIVEKPHISANEDGGVKTLKETDSSNIKAIQVYRSRKKKTNDLAFKDLNHPVEEIHSCRQNVRVTDASGYMASVIENADNLFTVPISMMENHGISRSSIEKQSSGSSLDCMNITNLNNFQLDAKSSVQFCEEPDHCFSGLDNTIFISVPVLYQYKHLYHNISASNSSSILLNEENNVGEYSIDSYDGRYKSLELRNDMAIPLFKTSEVKLLTEAISEAISIPKFQLLTSDEDKHMPENPVAEEQNELVCPRFSLPTEDHATDVDVDSEVHVEVSMADKPCSANCSVQYEVDRCSIAPSEDEMRKYEQDSILEGRELAQICSKATLLRDNCTATIASGGNEYSGEVFAVKNKQASAMNIRSYVRRKNKRKREVDHKEAQVYIETEKTIAVQKKVGVYKNVQDQQSSNDFARSPCEGLRSRKGKVIPTAQSEHEGVNRRISKVAVVGGSSVGVKDMFACDIEGCLMVFKTKEKLQLHKCNRCTYKKCRKLFSNHKYVIRHQHVHDDERPFKCPWKGCTVSFKWEWARTEHLSLHTGERPYRCQVAACGLSFRFVSDFSRHRRKSGHYVSTNGH